MSEKIFENYDEAHKYSLTIPWKIELCNTGETCWCRVIVPSEPIKFKEKISNWIKEDITRDFDCIIPDGSVDKETAEYIVDLHNDEVELEEKYKKRLEALQRLNDLDQELGLQ
jgi:hypothetical protein